MSDNKKWMKCDFCRGEGRIPCKTCHGKTFRDGGKTWPDYCGLRGCEGDYSGTQSCRICEGEGDVEAKALNKEQVEHLLYLFKNYGAEHLSGELVDISVAVLEAASRSEDISISNYEAIKYMLREYSEE